MKRAVYSVLIVMLSLSLSGLCLAVEPVIQVTVNGEAVVFDVPPQIIEGRTLVPLRAIFQALGATVYWDDATQTVSATRGTTTVFMQIGNVMMTSDNHDSVLDVPPQIIAGRTMVPARAVAEAFGAAVVWHPETQTVVISEETASTAASSETSTEEIVFTGLVQEGFFYNAAIENWFAFHFINLDPDVYASLQREIADYEDVFHQEEPYQIQLIAIDFWIDLHDWVGREVVISGEVTDPGRTNQQRNIVFDVQEINAVAQETESWYQLYLRQMMLAQEYAKAFSWEYGQPEDQFPTYLSDFLLADLNFDGIPELIICGETSLASWRTQIFSAAKGYLSLIFDDLVSGGIALYRDDSGAPFYALTQLGLVDDSLADPFYIVYEINERTNLGESFAEAVPRRAIYGYNAGEQDITYMFDYDTVSEEQYWDGIDSLFEGVSLIPGYPCSISELFEDRDGENAGYTVEELQHFLNSYVNYDE